MYQVGLVASSLSCINDGCMKLFYPIRLFNNAVTSLLLVCNFNIVLVWFLDSMMLKIADGRADSKLIVTIPLTSV